MMRDLSHSDYILGTTDLGVTGVMLRPRPLYIISSEQDSLRIRVVCVCRDTFGSSSSKRRCALQWGFLISAFTRDAGFNTTALTRLAALGVSRKKGIDYWRPQDI